MTGQSPWQPESDSDVAEQVHILVEGLKQVQRASNQAEPDPSSVAEAMERLRRSLLSLVVLPTEVIAQILKTAKQLVKGTGEIPGSIAKRIDPARQQADSRESRRQAQFDTPVAGQLPERSDAEIRDELDAVLAGLRARGIPAHVQEVNGNFIVAVSRPELIDEATAAGADTLKELQARAGQSVSLSATAEASTDVQANLSLKPNDQAEDGAD